MATYAAPVVYAVLLWWFSTGLILLLDHAPRRTHPWSMAAATLLLAAALVAVRASAGDASGNGAYTAFTAALVVWGWQEMSYYMGFISGPRPVACPPSCRGSERFFAALATSLWHEFAIVIGGLAILACYLTRAPMNRLFPLSVTLGTGAAALLGRAALADEVLAHELIGFTVLATLMALATLEHWFLMLPLPSAALWRWSLPGRSLDGARGAPD